MSHAPVRILLIFMTLAVFPAHAQPEADRRRISYQTYEEADNIDWRETNDYNAFLADSKRSMTIDRLATFLKIEAATRPPVKSGQ